MKYTNYIVLLAFVLLAGCSSSKIEVPDTVELMNDAGTSVAVSCDYSGVHTAKDFYIYVCHMEGVATPFNLRFKK